MRRAALPRAGITAGMMSPTTTEKMALALEELIAIVCEIVRERQRSPDAAAAITATIRELFANASTPARQAFGEGGA
jgi:hypothetical protein